MAKHVDNSIVLRALKDRFFKLATEENIPHTPKITKEIDHITEAIQTIQNLPPVPELADQI